MLQLDNNNSQRGPPLPHGSDINQTLPASALFPPPPLLPPPPLSSSLTNGNGLAVSSAHSVLLNGGPPLSSSSFITGLSAGPPGPLPSSHGPLLSAGGIAAHQAGPLPPPPVGSMIHWGTGSPHHLALHTANANNASSLQHVGSGVLCNNNNSNNNGNNSGLNNANNNNNNNNNSEDEDDDDYRPFTPPPPRERLSYTRYQLELLNGIYDEVRYPNSTQKQLIAKRVGITREQVKIWFQNRRRKDVVSKGGKSDGKDTNDNGSTTTTGDTNSNPDISDNNSNSSSTTTTTTTNTAVKPENMEVMESSSNHSVKSDSDTNGNTTTTPTPTPTASGSNTGNINSGRLSSQLKDESDSSESKDKMVSTVVLNSVIAELQKFNNEYLKQKKNRKKHKSKKSAASLAAAAAAAASHSASSASSSSCKSKSRLFQSYDMIAPPNKVTPTAFLNTSANRFKHAGGTSAFQNPRENRLMPICTPLNLGDNRLWDGFAAGLTNGSSIPSSSSSSFPAASAAAMEAAASDFFHQQRSSAEPPLPSAISAIPSIPSSSSLATSFAIQNHHQTSHHHHHQQAQAAAFSGLLSGSMAAVHHLNSQPSIYDNIPVLSDLLNSYKNQQSASAVAAAAVAHRQQLEHSLLSSTCGSPGRPHPPTQPFFHLPSGGPHSSASSLGGSGSSSSSIGAPSSSSSNNGSNNNTSTSDDSSKSPLSDLTFPSPTAPPTHPFSFNSPHHPHHPHHHPHHSHPHSSAAFALNRVFPFPLIADPPVMLSTIRQSDATTFRTHPSHHQWPHPPSSLSQSNPPVGVGQSLGSSQLSSPSSEDPYRPLLISSLNNPYFSPTPSNSYPSFSPTSLPPAPQHSWPNTPSGSDSADFAPI